MWTKKRLNALVKSNYNPVCDTDEHLIEIVGFARWDEMCEQEEKDYLEAVKYRYGRMRWFHIRNMFKFR